MRLNPPWPKTDWYTSETFKHVRIKDWLIVFGAAPLGAYFVGWLPTWGLKDGWLTPWDWLVAQYQAYDAQLRVVSNHPYMSQWHQWIFPTRPMWYAFEREGYSLEWVRGVICLGSPLIHWVGALALAALVVRFVRTRDRLAGWVTWMTLGHWLCWSVIPRKILFYYYVYPPFLLLTPVIAVFLRDFKAPNRFAGVQALPWEKIKSGLAAALLCAVIAMFCYFYPILAALKIPKDGFQQWMWLRSWI